MNEARRSNFLIGFNEITDPCKTCIVGIVCNQDLCAVKIRYNKTVKQNESRSITIKNSKLKASRYVQTRRRR